MFEFLGKAKHDDCKENVVTRFLGSIRIVITVGSKIIRALEIVRVKKLIPNAVS